MKEIDAGHEYLLDSYDGGDPVRLTFMKREGEGYPFNAGHHPGTNCQEVIRALIARVQYLQKQIPCDENDQIVNDLRSALWKFELRAAKRHGRASVFPWRETYQPVPIESQPACTHCGHVGCTAHQDTLDRGVASESIEVNDERKTTGEDRLFVSRVRRPV